jgi:hypothetical protein
VRPVEEVADLLKVVAHGISNVRMIIDAARDGHQYLQGHHPDAQADLAKLLDQFGKLTEYLAEASSIITGFAFAVTGTAFDREPRAFNDLLVKRQAVFARFDAQPELTRAHCSEIGMHAWASRQQAEKNGMHNLFGLVNAGKQRAEEMSEQIERVYGNDAKLLTEFQNMAKAVRLGLDDIQAALGPPGQMLVENVPVAAELLGRYATEFLPIQLRADDTKRELHALVNDLRFPQLTPTPATSG